MSNYELPNQLEFELRIVKFIQTLSSPPEIVGIDFEAFGNVSSWLIISEIGL